MGWNPKETELDGSLNYLCLSYWGSTVCIFSPQRIHLDISVGEHANDYQEIAAKDKLTELQLRIRQLLDQVEQISKEQNYQRVGCITWPESSVCR